MAQRQVVWSSIARQEMKDILDYWTKRNKSSIYSNKLYDKVEDYLETVAKNPFAGRETKRDNVRYIIMGDYSIIYRVTEKLLIVVSIWDDRQDPKKSRVSKK